jgi:hypothetical protein
MQGVRWFIARNNEKVGPFSSGDLKQMARHQMLQPKELVWMEGTSKWVEAATLPGLFPSANGKKYWLAVGDQTHGPFVADQIRAGLSARYFNLETQVFADDTRQWLPLSQLPEFHESKAEVPLTPQRAQVLTGSLEFQEPKVREAEQSGDGLTKLISTLRVMKRNYTGNPLLTENLDATIAKLRAKRHEAPPAAVQTPLPPRK